MHLNCQAETKPPLCPTMDRLPIDAQLKIIHRWFVWSCLLGGWMNGGSLEDAIWAYLETTNNNVLICSNCGWIMNNQGAIWAYLETKICFCWSCLCIYSSPAICLCSAFQRNFVFRLSQSFSMLCVCGCTDLRIIFDWKGKDRGLKIFLGFWLKREGMRCDRQSEN